MFFRIINLKRGRKNYKYLKLVETKRKKGKVIQKTLLSFGNIEEWPKERLLEPYSKLRVSEWIKTQAVNEIYPDEIRLHHYYRSMDYLIAHKEEDIFWKVNDIFNVDLSLVFYDLTSSYFEGDCCKIARYGYSRDKRPDLHQIEIALLVNREGIPIAHEVFEGNIKDIKTGRNHTMI